MADAESSHTHDNDSDNDTMTMYKCRKCEQQFHADELDAHRELHRQEKAKQIRRGNRGTRATSPSQSVGTSTIFTQVKNAALTGSKRSGRKPVNRDKKQRRIRSNKTYNQKTAKAAKEEKVDGG